MERLGQTGGRLKQLKKLLSTEKVASRFSEKNFCAGRILHSPKRSRITYEPFPPILDRRQLLCPSALFFLPFIRKQPDLFPAVSLFLKVF